MESENNQPESTNSKAPESNSIASDNIEGKQQNSARQRRRRGGRRNGPRNSEPAQEKHESGENIEEKKNESENKDQISENQANSRTGRRRRGGRNARNVRTQVEENVNDKNSHPEQTGESEIKESAVPDANSATDLTYSRENSSNVGRGGREYSRTNRGGRRRRRSRERRRTKKNGKKNEDHNPAENQQPKLSYAEEYKEIIDHYLKLKGGNESADALEDFLQDLVKKVFFGLKKQVAEDAAVDAVQFVLQEQNKLILGQTEVAVCLVQEACQLGFPNLLQLVLDYEKKERNRAPAGSLAIPLIQMPGERNKTALEVASAKYSSLSYKKRRRSSPENNDQKKEGVWKCVMILVSELGFSEAFGLDHGIQSNEVRNMLFAHIGLSSLLNDVYEQCKGLDLRNDAPLGYVCAILEHWVSFHNSSFNDKSTYDLWTQATKTPLTELNIRFVLDVLADPAAKPSVVHSWTLILTELCFQTASKEKNEVEAKNETIKEILSDASVWTALFDCIIRLGMQMVFGLVGQIEGPHGENLYEREGQCFDAFWELFLRLHYHFVKDFNTQEEFQTQGSQLQQVFSMLNLALEVIDGDPEEPKRFGHLIQGFHVWSLLTCGDTHIKQQVQAALNKNTVMLLERKTGNRRKKSARSSFNAFKALSSDSDIPLPPEFVEKMKSIPPSSLKLLVQASPDILQKISMLTRIDGMIGIQEKIEYIHSQLSYGSGFTLHVNRLALAPKDMVELFIAQLSCIDVNALRSSLDIEYVGEPASGAGPVREFLDIMGHVLFSPKLNVDKEISDLSMRSLRADFEAITISSTENESQQPKAENQTKHTSAEGEQLSFWQCFPLFIRGDERSSFIIPKRGRSKMNQQRSQYFRTAGRILGISIKYAAPLGVLFPPAVWAMLLGNEVSWEECCAGDTTFLESMKMLLEEPLAEESHLTFSVTEKGIGEIDLTPGGQNIHVTEENKHEYVTVFSRYKLLKGAGEEIEQIRKGLLDVIPNYLLKLFTPSEISEAVHGPKEINIKDLKQGVEFYENASSHPVAKYFWSIVEEFNDEQLRLLLLFWSGSSFPPFHRISDEDEQWKIYVDLSDDSSKLPQATTCERSLYLPCYSTKEQMKEKLLMAIEFGAVGFDKM